MHIEFIVTLLFLLSKKCNKYLLLLFIIISSYFLIYYKNFSNKFINFDLYSLINETTLMPEIIDKVPF